MLIHREQKEEMLHDASKPKYLQIHIDPNRAPNAMCNRTRTLHVILHGIRKEKEYALPLLINRMPRYALQKTPNGT